LPLMDEAALGRVQVLDGIFEGDHVGGPRSVDLADERGERRRLARAGRSVEKHQSVEQGTQRSERAREPQLLQGGNAVANGAERRGGGWPRGRGRAPRRRAIRGSRVGAPPSMSKATRARLRRAGGPSARRSIAP